jgi:Rieske Fe-S protein
MFFTNKPTNLNRRQFLLLSAGLVAGCKTADDGASAIHAERVVDAGLASRYAADGVYAGFRDQGFFVIRNGENLFALSAFCTHRKCKLIAEADRSFYCKCHGSTFDANGKVTKGPAKRDLPVLSLVADEKGELLVKVPAL